MQSRQVSMQNAGPSQDQDRNVPLAMMALLTETALMIAIASVAKLLAPEISIQVIILFRYVFCLPLLVILSLWQFGREAFAVTDFRTLAYRSVFGLLGITFFMFAIAAIDITKATAIQQLLPVFITLLAPFILGERVGIRRWSAVCAGLVGALVLIRPDLEGWLQPGVAYALAAPLFAALMFIFLRKLGASDSPAKTAMLYNMFGTAVFSVWCSFGDFDWPTTRIEVVALVACGLVASLQQWLMAVSHKLAPASTLAPIHYSSVPLSIVSGILLFGENITLTFVLGTSIIIGSTYYIFVRDRRIRT